MRILNTYILSMLLSIMMQGCDGSEPNRNDFIGTWKADDGAIVELQANGNCTISNVNFKKIYAFKNDTTQILNCNGSWIFTNTDDTPQIDISYYDGKTYEYKGEIRKSKRGFEFEILGQGAFENKQTWILYTIIGDPEDIDESNKYRFLKQ